jgi:DNA transformation protein and related proteins
MTKKDESFRDFVLDQLQELDGVEARRMFGGFGLYCEETFFGILHKGRVYFKIDDSTVGAYRRHKMKPFRPNPKQTLKSYFQVPVDVIEDRDQLRVWAMKAMGCQTSKQSISRTG